ncbi:MAG: SDR family NAD(P)-dependent oxidoreductase [Caldilineaceae bacterium]|nr:SDR family NAD(P)-dependent oxidoreductase [Caldilineaceae bacterium]
MIQATNPRILTISSQMGSLNRKSTGMYAYRSSKAAVNKVMQVLALELQAHGIIVCPLHPGWVQTDMGGTEADITVQASAAGIIEFVRTVTMKQSGRFFTGEGEEHAW